MILCVVVDVVDGVNDMVVGGVQWHARERSAVGDAVGVHCGVEGGGDVIV